MRVLQFFSPEFLLSISTVFRFNVMSLLPCGFTTGSISSNSTSRKFYRSLKLEGFFQAGVFCLGRKILLVLRALHFRSAESIPRNEGLRFQAKGFFGLQPQVRGRRTVLKPLWSGIAHIHHFLRPGGPHANTQSFQMARGAKEVPLHEGGFARERRRSVEPGESWHKRSGETHSPG